MGSKPISWSIIISIKYFETSQDNVPIYNAFLTEGPALQKDFEGVEILTYHWPWLSGQLTEMTQGPANV